MPIYEYQCRNCGNKFEAFCRIAGDDKEIKCPKCGADNPRRVFSKFSSASQSGCAPTPRRYG